MGESMGQKDELSEDSLLKHAYRITELEKRVKALETALFALQVGAGDGSKHKNDGGWFD